MPFSYSGPGPLIGFNWYESAATPLLENPVYFDQTAIDFHPCMNGQAAQITVNDIPCGQLTIPIGFIDGYVQYDGETEHVSFGYMITSKNRRVFQNVIFPPVSGTTNTGGRNFAVPASDFNKIRGVASGEYAAASEEPPDGTLALIGYAVDETYNLPNYLYNYDEDDEGWGSGDRLITFDNSKIHFCLARKNLNSNYSNAWEEIETHNGIYVHKVRLDGDDLSTTSDDIDEDNIPLPDPVSVAENILLVVKYNETASSVHWSNQAQELPDDEGRITDPSSISMEMYYKGIKINGSAEEIVWIPIQSFGSSSSGMSYLVLNVTDETYEGGVVLEARLFSPTSSSSTMIAIEDLINQQIGVYVNPPENASMYDTGYDNSNYGDFYIRFMNATFQGNDLSEEEDPFGVYARLDFLPYYTDGFGYIKGYSSSFDVTISGFFENYNFGAAFDNNSGLVVGSRRGFVPAPSVGLSGNAILTTSGWQEPSGSSINWEDWIAPSNP